MRKEIAIITGATGGLGREFTRQLIEEVDEIQDCLSHEEYFVKYLVNNAGSGRMASSVSFSAQEIESHISTHDTAMAVLFQSVSAQMDHELVDEINKKVY